MLPVKADSWRFIPSEDSYKLSGGSRHQRDKTVKQAEGCLAGAIHLTTSDATDVTDSESFPEVLNMEMEKLNLKERQGTFPFYS